MHENPQNSSFFPPHLNKKVLGLGSPLAISHQLLLTFPEGEENSSQSVKPPHRDESPLHGNTTSRVSSSGSIRKHSARVTGWSYTSRGVKCKFIQHRLKKQTFFLFHDHVFTLFAVF